MFTCLSSLSEISNFFFQIYSVPGQYKSRRKTFLEWKSIDLSFKLSLTCVGNINYIKDVCNSSRKQINKYYKSFNHPIPTLPVEIGNTLAIFKLN